MTAKKKSATTISETKQENESQIMKVFRQIPEASKILDDLNVVMKHETKRNTNKEVLEFGKVVGNLFELLDAELKDKNEVTESDDATNILTSCIKSLNFGEKRLFISSILTQFLRVYSKKISVENLKMLEKDHIKDVQAAPCFFMVSLCESGILPVNGENKEEWNTRIAQLVQTYGFKKNMKYRNLIAETLIRIVEHALKTDKTLAKAIVDEHLAPLIVTSDWQLHHYTLAYNLALLFPKHFSIQSRDKSENNMLLSNKFIDALYEYLQFSDTLPPIVDPHIDALSKQPSDTITPKIKYFLERGVFTASGVKPGADYCSKLLSNAAIATHFPFSNQQFIKSWPSASKRSSHRELASVGKLDKLLKHTIAEHENILIDLVNELQADTTNFVLRKHLTRLVSNTLLPDMKAVLGVVRYVLQKNISDEVAIAIIQGIETNCRNYDAQKCDPERILELLKILFVPAFFKYAQTDDKFLLRGSPSDELRNAITKQLLAFMKNLSLLEQTNEIHYFTKNKTAKLFPTQMKPWAHELLKFENQLLAGYDKKFKVRKLMEFSDMDKDVRKQLQAVRDKIVKVLAKISASENNNTITARLCCLKVLINHILICQLHNPEVITLDMVSDFSRFVSDVFDPKSSTNDMKDGDEEPPKPIEVFVDILIGLATVEPSLTYALRMCLFAFSSYLNEECFKLLFQSLNLNDQENAPDSDDEDMEEAAETKAQNGNSQPSTSDKMVDDSDSDDEESDDDEEANGTEESSDKEEEESNDTQMDEDMDDQDAMMFKLDAMIAQQFKLRKLEAQRKKAALQPKMEVAKNILTMLEGLVHQSTPSFVLLHIFIECMSFVRARSASPKLQILERVIAIAKNVIKVKGKAIFDSISETGEAKLPAEEIQIIQTHSLSELKHIIKFITSKKLLESSANENTKGSIKSVLLEKGIPFFISVLDRLIAVESSSELIEQATSLVYKIIAKHFFRFKLQNAFSFGIPNLLPHLTRTVTRRLQALNNKSNIIEYFFFAASASKKESTFFLNNNDLKNCMDLLIKQTSSFEKKVQKTQKVELAHFLYALQRVSEIAKNTAVEYNPADIKKITESVEKLRVHHQQNHKTIDAILQAIKALKASENTPVYQADVYTPEPKKKEAKSKAAKQEEKSTKSKKESKKEEKSKDKKTKQEKKDEQKEQKKEEKPAKQEEKSKQSTKKSASKKRKNTSTNEGEKPAKKVKIN